MIGVAISVASTVVLVRMLMDNDVLHTGQGQIAVGRLVVEDISLSWLWLCYPGSVVAWV